MYTLSRSVRKSVASEPPTPAFSSNSAEKNCVCEGGTSNAGNVVERYVDRPSLSVVNSSSAKERIVGSGSLSRGSVSSRDY